MAAWRYHGGVVSQPGDAEFVESRMVSASLFSVIGVPLLSGRAFLPQEDRIGAAPVAVISRFRHHLWSARPQHWLGYDERPHCRYRRRG
jgi:hypothetical protein